MRCFMKRAICVLFMVLIFSSMSFASKASSLQADFCANLGKYDDGYIVVNYEVKESSYISAMGLEFTYDFDNAEVVEVTEGDLLDYGMMQYNKKINGKVILSFISTSALTEKCSIASVKYKLKKNIKNNLVFGIEVTEAVNENYENIGCTVKNAIYVPDDIETIVEEDTPTNSGDTEQTTVQNENEPYREIEKITDEKTVSEINRLLGKDKQDNIYKIAISGNSFADEEENITAVFVKNKQDEFRKISPVINESTGQIIYQGIDNESEEIYIVKKEDNNTGESLANKYVSTEDSLSTMDSINNENNLVFVFIVIGVVLTVTIAIIIIMKVGRKNEKQS